MISIGDLCERLQWNYSSDNGIFLKYLRSSSAELNIISSFSSNGCARAANILFWVLGLNPSSSHTDRFNRFSRTNWAKYIFTTPDRFVPIFFARHSKSISPYTHLEGGKFDSFEICVVYRFSARCSYNHRMDKRPRKLANHSMWRKSEKMEKSTKNIESIAKRYIIMPEMYHKIICLLPFLYELTLAWKSVLKLRRNARGFPWPFCWRALWKSIPRSQKSLKSVWTKKHSMLTGLLRKVGNRWRNSLRLWNQNDSNRPFVLKRTRFIW